MFNLNDLIERKFALGLTNSVIAKKSGVSKTTVDRIMAGRHDRATFANIAQIAAALNMSIHFVPKESAEAVLERRAKLKAMQIVDSVQANSGLESQALGSRELQKMRKRTLHELMAGPKRRLWQDD